MIQNNQLYYNNSGVVYDADAELYFSQLSPSPSNEYKSAINILILQLKEDGNWSKLDRLWIFATEAQQNARVSVTNPFSSQIIEVNSPTWTSNQGYDFNGTTQYLRTAYIPSVDGVNYTLNSAEHGLYSIENATSGSFAWDMGAMSATDVSNLNIRDSSDIAYGKVNNAVANIISAARRTGAGAINLFKNGVSIASDTDASTALPPVEFYIGAQNNNGVASAFSNRRIAFVFMASGTITDLTFYNAMQEFATTRGFNV